MKKDIFICLLLLLVLVLYVFGFNYIEDYVYKLDPNRIGLTTKYDLPRLTLDFLIICVKGCVLSIILGTLIGIFCFTDLGEEFKIIIERGVMLLYSFPGIALIIIVIRTVGAGQKAALLTLVAYGILPIIFGIISGFENIDNIYIDIAKSLGMNRYQTLFKVQLPIALPVLISSIRTSLIACIGMATLGFNTGAGGLGIIIDAGFVGYNTLYLIQGTVPIILIALIADTLLRVFEYKLTCR